MRPIKHLFLLVFIAVFVNAGMMVSMAETEIPGFNLVSLLRNKPSAKANVSRSLDAPYYLTFTLPEKAGRRFASVSLSEQTQGQGAPTLQFDLPKTTGFIGTPNAKGKAIAIKNAAVDETGTIWVEFNPAIPPKTTLTLAFKSRQSISKNTRQVGIAAYPDVDYPVAIFVGNQPLTHP
jgi:Protein of unknown function (DUF2808)